MVTRMIMNQMITSTGEVYRRFIPKEEGESLEEQLYPWNTEGLRQKMAEKPLTMADLSHKTMTNILQMRAVEVQHWHDYHAYSKMISDPDFKKLMNAISWAEHLHHVKLQSLLPPVKAPSESVLMEEMALIMGYQMGVNTEPDDSIKNAFEHIVQDHKLHAEYAAQPAKRSGTDVDRIIGGMDISGGRPLEQQYMRPDDTMWQGQFDGVYKKDSVNPQTLVNVDMCLAGELSAWMGYGCASKFETDQSVKLHYAAFENIEDQHISILGSIKDPTESVLERTLVHEQVEMQEYKRMMEEEEHPQVRKVFEDLYREDMEQARLFGQFV